MTPQIEVQNLSKTYRVPEREAGLLALVRGLVRRTYRDVKAVRDISFEVIAAETVAPSPVAAGLLHDFISQYMYEWDQPKAERQMGALLLGRELLAELLDEASLPDLLKPEAVRAVEAQLQYLADGRRAVRRRRRCLGRAVGR